MRGLVYMVSRAKVDVDTFHKGIQYALEKLDADLCRFQRLLCPLDYKTTGLETSDHVGFFRFADRLILWSRWPQHSGNL